ncbi:hypothetical protein [Streptomyces sp. NPDC088115]|uniref:hypothetical protein n=1 Tax=Streptomyces sp. NPDC088115 TaxID=3365824 RepID=UPI003816A176
MRTNTRLTALAASAAVLSLAGAGAATADDRGDGDGNIGTTVNWTSNDGNGNVTFFDDGSSFQGTAQFPSEGPVGYRGSLSD